MENNRYPGEVSELLECGLEALSGLIIDHLQLELPAQVYRLSAGSSPYADRG